MKNNIYIYIILKIKISKNKIYLKYKIYFIYYIYFFNKINIIIFFYDMIISIF